MHYFIVSNVKNVALQSSLELLKFKGMVSDDASNLSDAVLVDDWGRGTRYIGTYNNFIILTDFFISQYFIRTRRWKGDYEKYLLKTFPDSDMVMVSYDEDEYNGYSIVYFSKGQKIYTEQLLEHNYVRCGYSFPYESEILNSNKENRSNEFIEINRLGVIGEIGRKIAEKIIYFFLHIDDLSVIPMYKINGSLSDEFADETYQGADPDNQLWNW